MIKILTTVAILVATAASSLVHAQTSADEFRGVLSAIDTVPTREGLLARWPDARDRMIAAARDNALDGYRRQRAITLLSLFPEDRVRDVLLTLSTDTDGSVRRYSIYTLGRTFGPMGDAQAERRVIEATTDRDGRVRLMAVRALRWARGSAAARTLRTLADSEDQSLARAAERSLVRSQRGSMMNENVSSGSDVAQ